MNYMRVASLIIALLPLVAQAQSESWEAIRTKAVEAMRNGKWQQAEPLLQSALQEAEKDGGEPLFTSLKDLADFYQMQGRPADSERYLRRTVELRESVSGPGHDDVARALQDLARNLLLQRKAADGEAGLKRALAILESNHGDRAVELFPATALGFQLYQAMGNWTAAELLLLRTVAIREAAAGPDSLDLVADIVNLGDFYVRRTRWPVAEPQFRRALGISETKLGPDHPSLAPLLDKLAAICRELRRPSEAEAFLRRALMLRERVNGPVHQDVATTLDALGSLAYSGKRYEEAEQLYNRSLPIWIAILGGDHPLLASSYDNLAVAQASLNNYEDSAANYGKSLAIREAGVVRSVYFLARVLEAEGKPGEAESLYTANKRFIDRLPESSEVLPFVLDHYASLLRKASKSAAAARIEAQARLIGRTKQKEKTAEPSQQLPVILMTPHGLVDALPALLLGLRGVHIGFALVPGDLGPQLLITLPSFRIERPIGQRRLHRASLFDSMGAIPETALERQRSDVVECRFQALLPCP